jgi:hypothetical protein
MDELLKGYLLAAYRERMYFRELEPGEAEAAVDRFVAQTNEWEDEAWLGKLEGRKWKVAYCMAYDWFYCEATTLHEAVNESTEELQRCA